MTCAHCCVLSHINKMIIVRKRRLFDMSSKVIISYLEKKKVKRNLKDNFISYLDHNDYKLIIGIMYRIKEKFLLTWMELLAKVKKLLLNSYSFVLLVDICTFI